MQKAENRGRKRQKAENHPEESIPENRRESHGADAALAEKEKTRCFAEKNEETGDEQTVGCEMTATGIKCE